jgi:hypothetical protein
VILRQQSAANPHPVEKTQQFQIDDLTDFL